MASRKNVIDIKNIDYETMEFFHAWLRGHCSKEQLDRNIKILLQDMRGDAVFRSAISRLLEVHRKHG